MYKQLLLILIFPFYLISCKSEATLVKEVRNVENFSTISVSAGIDVFYTQEELSPVTIETKADLIPKISTTVKDGTLTITRSDNEKQKHDEKSKIKVYISTLRLDNIVISNGAEFYAAGIKGENIFSIISSNGGGIKIDELIINNDIQIKLTRGADCNIKYLRASNCTVNVGKACDFEIVITSEDTLDVMAETTSDVVLKGKVHKLVINENIGADINYRELEYDILSQPRSSRYME